MTMQTTTPVSLQEGAGRCIPIVRPHRWSKWALYEVPRTVGLGRSVAVLQRRRCLRCGIYQDRAVMS